MLSFHWQAKTEYVGHEMNVHPTSILCVSYRDPRHNKLVTLAVNPDRPRDDKDLCGRLHRLLSYCGEENVVLLYQNGDRFDLPKIEARFIFYGLPPLPKMLTIDTLREARKFGFDYNRLDFLDKHLNGVGKVETRGWPMWRDIVLSDSPVKKRREALKEMQHYCEGDILALERVYNRLRPYMKVHPNANLWQGTRASCPTCGSAKVIKRRRPIFTPTRAYRELSCKKCGRFFREVKSLEDYRPKVTNRL
jgi:uncharacterized protein YprB with RNaseH-like and TPR domain